MIDSIKGYGQMARGREYVMALHALAAYLKSAGASVLLTNEMETITGDFQATATGLSYLADNIIFLRYLELQGEFARPLGCSRSGSAALKKRSVKSRSRSTVSGSEHP